MKVLQPSLPRAVTQWDRERLLLRREASSGMYSVRAWFTAKTATVTPVQLVQTAVRPAGSRPTLFGMGLVKCVTAARPGWARWACRVAVITLPLTLPLRGVLLSMLLC